MEDPAKLEKRWYGLYERVTGHDRSDPSARGWLALLKQQYEGEDRHYHNFAHIGYMRELLYIECSDMAEDPDALEWAIWFHDLFYFTRPAALAALNEDLSAEIATLDSRLSDEFKFKVRDLIKITKYPTARKHSVDAQLISDLDLAILGIAPPGFEVYEGMIREEYAWVPEEVFRAERLKILEEFASISPIYQTEFWREQKEEGARHNIALAIERLKG